MPVARALTASLTAKGRGKVALKELQAISEAVVEVAAGSAGCKGEVLLAGADAAILGALRHLGVADARVTAALITLKPELAGGALL